MTASQIKLLQLLDYFDRGLMTAESFTDQFTDLDTLQVQPGDLDDEMEEILAPVFDAASYYSASPRDRQIWPGFTDEAQVGEAVRHAISRLKELDRWLPRYLAVRFSPEESQQLQQALASLAPGCGSTISSLLTDWACFVARVEGGYEGGWSQYLEGVCLRELLGKVMEAVPEVIGDKLRWAVSDLDDRFLAVTRVPEEGDPQYDLPWWRLPLRLTERLVWEMAGEAGCPGGRGSG